MSTVSEAERLARAWIQGWIDGAPDHIPLSTGFRHSSPFGVVTGREKYLEWVKPLAASNVASLKILKTVGNKTDAAIWFEMTTPYGTVPCCDWVEVDNGEIIAVTSFYDATDLR